jgi:predicted TIM-barrel fold metal-dependent hydrolase
MTIDVHTHFMTPRHWGTEWEKHWQPVYGYPFPVVTPEIFDNAMEDIDVAIVFGIRATAASVATPNEEIAEFCGATRTKTIGFMALDPTDEDVMEQMENGIDCGLRGIKLYPVLSLFDATDEKYDDFFQVAQDNRLPILWHMGASASPIADLSLSQPLIIDNVARRFPNLTQIIAHIGHPWQRETLMVIRKNRRVFSDISASWARPYEGFNALIRAQEWGVVDKLLFASDFPLWTPKDAIAGLWEISKIRAGTLPFVTEETINQILTQDSLGLLGLQDAVGGLMSAEIL